MKDQRLQVEVEGDELVIRIGIATLSFSAERCQGLVEYPGEVDPPYCKIIDPKELALDVCNELSSEEEDGTTPLDLLLDQCIVRAMEEGSLAFDETFVVASAGDEDDGDDDNLT